MGNCICGKSEDIYGKCTHENTPEFTFNEIHRLVKILKVIDGDTVDIAVYHDDDNKTKIYKHRVRLYGIDTPEKRPSLNDPNRQKEIEASLRAKTALETCVNENDSLFIAHFYKNDKYGRLLCTLYDKNGEDINKWMINNGYAYEYFGKTKKKFEAKE